MIDVTDGKYKGCVVVQVADSLQAKMTANTPEVDKTMNACAGTTCAMLK